MMIPGDIKPVLRALETYRTVEKPSDFPPASNGVITLADNTAYYILGTIDLLGDRIVSGENSVFIGASPEYSILKSTGFDDSSGAFLTSEYTTPANLIAFHDFGSEQVLDIDGLGNTTGYDWNDVNFLNCSNVGVVKDVGNFICNTIGFLNSSGLTFDGSIGTISFSDTIFECASGGTCITIPSTMTITRRLRIAYSAFVVLAGETGVNFSTSATVPDEGYILDTVNFGGGGSYQVGVDKLGETSHFIQCRGIENTSTQAGYYMTDNATVTTCTLADTFYKIAGTTTAGNLVEKFTLTNNRATYTGALTAGFSVSVSCSVETINGRDYTFKIAVNGTTQSARSIIRGRSNINLECSMFDSVVLSANDYVEVFLACSNAGEDVEITDMNVIISKHN